jgi:hypothetical protein
VTTAGDQLGTFNWQTGSFTLLGTLSSGETIEDLAHFPGGALYGANSSAELLNINPTTLTTTEIGAMGNSIEGIKFSAGGTLFGYSRNSLYTINPNTGAATLVGSLNVSSATYYDAAFDDSTNLFFFEGNNLYTVNTNTGSASLVGTIGSDFTVYGLAYENSTLYGFTAAGQIITINTVTGAGTFLVDESQASPIYAASGGGLAVGAPALNITQSAANLTVSWPFASGYTLEQNTNLANPAGWVTSTNTISTSDGTNYIILMSPTGNLFFRLQ